MSSTWTGTRSSVTSASRPWACQDAGDRVISVDTKKKELVGDFANGGKEYRPEGSPVPVRSHDFMDKDLGKAIPYGVYDVAASAGGPTLFDYYIIVGVRCGVDPPLVEGDGPGRLPARPAAAVPAHPCGSNSYRTRAWKAELAALALETGLAVTVCHFPPGTSKWNKIEHRLFSHITMNWRRQAAGQPRRHRLHHRRHHHPRRA